MLSVAAQGEALTAKGEAGGDKSWEQDRNSFRRPRFYSAVDLVEGFEAIRADMNLAHSIADNDSTLLNIWVPASLDVTLRETDVIAKLRASAADFTFRHD